MARYIDADALLKNWCEAYCKPKENCTDDCSYYDAITQAPTANVRENVTGEWIDDEFIGQYRCSECDYYSIDEYDFCPNCGADMHPQYEEPEINPCRGCLDYDGLGGCKSSGGCGMDMRH